MLLETLVSYFALTSVSFKVLLKSLCMSGFKGRISMTTRKRSHIMFSDLRALRDGSGHAGTYLPGSSYYAFEVPQTWPHCYMIIKPKCYLLLNSLFSTDASSSFFWPSNVTIIPSITPFLSSKLNQCHYWFPSIHCITYFFPLLSYNLFPRLRLHCLNTVCKYSLHNIYG